MTEPAPPGSATPAPDPAPDPALGALLHPRHCTLSLSPDRRHAALAFAVPGGKPLVVVLPLDGLVGLQRRMAEGLLHMGTLAMDEPAAA